MRRVDKLSGAYVNTRVAYVAAVSRREKDDIPYLQSGRRHRRAVVSKTCRSAVQRIAEMSVAVVHKP